MLITFLIGMLALIIAILGCALLSPGSHANGVGRHDAGAADWESSI